MLNERSRHNLRPIRGIEIWELIFRTFEVIIAFENSSIFDQSYLENVLYESLENGGASQFSLVLEDFESGMFRKNRIRA